MKHPLLNHQLFNDGADLFVKKLLGRKLETVNASRRGQLAIADVMNPILKRIKYDDDQVVKIYPSVPDVNSPRIISMTLSVAAGRPVVDGSGVRAISIWNRYRAGETIESLSDDYQIKPEEVQTAVDYIDFIEHPAA